jgi:hypothetical protein
MKNGFFLILSLALFLFAVFLMYTAPTLDSWQAVTFIAGVLFMAAAFAVPINVLGKR